MSIGSRLGLRSTTAIDAVEKPIPPGARVVVIGAGFAGIGAAGLLQERGYQVELIEARDRLGGRAHSESLNGFPIDLGANWLKLNNNELLPIAERHGLISHSSNLQVGALLHQGEMSFAEAGDLETMFESALAIPYLKYQTARRLGQRPRAQTAEALIGSIIDSDPRNGLSSRRLLSGMFATDLDTLSGDVLIGAGSDAASEPDELIEPTVVGGMQALAAALAKPLTPSFEEHVQRISRTASGVEVTTNKRLIAADAVIVTVSVGVLKNKGIVFEQGLPKRHIDSLNAMDMGCFAKLWIRYPEAAWSLPKDLLVLCDSAELHAVVDFSKSHSAPVLLAFTSGRQGRALEEMPDEEAKRLLHETLRDQLKINLPAPTGFAKSQWTRDPLAGGSYMYPNAEFRAGDNKRLRAPIADRILLAGEALADQFGYVDTAWTDGRRAAQVLMGVTVS